jgi:hypothetical protein
MALGQLIVKVAANIAEFQSGMDKAAHLADKNFTSMQDAARKASAAVGLAFTAAAGATVALVKRQIDLADNMSLVAQQIGVTVESLSALAYAADQNGVKMQEFSSDAAQLAKNMSDAAKGTGQALPAFKAMGISVTDASGNLKDMGTILDEVADKFATYRDGTNKTALAVQIFGTQGAKLIPMLNGGSKALKEAAGEAKQFGAVISTGTANAANQFNDNLSRMKAIVDGLGNEIMADLMPNLQGLSDDMVEAAKKGGGLETAARAAADGIRILASAALIAAQGFEIVGTAIGDYTAIAVTTAQKLGQGKNPWSSMFPDNKMMNAATTNSQKWGKSVLSEFEGVNDELLSKADNLRTQLSNIWDVTPAAKSTNSVASNSPDAPAIKNVQKAAAAAKALAATTAAAVKTVWDSVATPADVLANKEEILKKLFDAGAISSSLYAAAMEKVKKQFEDAANSADPLIAVGKQMHESLMKPMEKVSAQTVQLNKLLDDGAISFDDYWRKTLQDQDAADKIKKVGDAVKQNTKFAQDMGLTFSSAFENAIVEGDKFSEVLRGLGQDILRIATRDLITEPLGKAVSGFIEGLLPSAKGNVFLNGNLQAFAEGGVVSSPALFPMAGGRTGLMGEAGPEAIMPLARGSDGKLGVRAGRGSGADVSTGGGIGGVTINYNIGTVDARGADSSSTAQLQRLYEATLQPKVVNAIVAKAEADIFAKIHRGGAWSRAVGKRR